VRYPVLCCGLAILGLATVGCAHRKTGDAQLVEPAPIIPDLSDCVLFYFHSPAGATGHEFTPEQRDALARIFGEQVLYEHYVVGHLGSGPPGMVMTVVRPEQGQSLTYEDGEPGYEYRARVWGFFPDVESGRLPRELGEALVLAEAPMASALEGGAGDGSQIEGAPRELGAAFHPYPIRDHRLTVVGLCRLNEPGGETVWVRELPERDERSSGMCEERASAVLADMNEYERAQEELALAALPATWAIRLRGAKVDMTWGVGGRERSCLGVSARSEGTAIGLSIYLREGPLPVEEVTLALDGEPVEVEWWRPEVREGEETYDRAPVGDAFEADRGYRAEIRAQPDEKRHHVVVYIHRRPEGSCFFEWPRRREPGG
jgi:hypothetical protein